MVEKPSSRIADNVKVIAVLEGNKQTEQPSQI